MASNLEATLSSSPDPLTVSPFSLKGIKPLPRRSTSGRKVIAQHTDYVQRERITRSPSKTIAFTTPADPGSSPWKIRVTVQAEPRAEDKVNDGKTGSRIGKGTKTRSVPLKGENESSPIKRRGRPRKSEGSPEGRKRSLTPARRRSSNVKKFIPDLGIDNDEVLYPAMKSTSGHYRRSRRLELVNGAQDDKLTGERGGSPSTDELTKVSTVNSNARSGRAPNFESLTPLYKKHSKLPQPRASSPRTPDQTMKSVKGRRCTPVKPNGWSEDQLSPISSEYSIDNADQESDLDLSDINRESLQIVSKDNSSGKLMSSQLDTEMIQDETLSLKNFVSPPVRHRGGDESLGQELETMLADGENQSILSCEDFSVVSIDSLPSRQEASSFVGDTSNCDAPKTPGIDSIIANFQIEDSIRDEQISERDALTAIVAARTDVLPTSPNASVRQANDRNENSRHSVSFELPAAHSTSTADSTSLLEVSTISSIAYENPQAVASIPKQPLRNESKGFIARLGGLFVGNHHKIDENKIIEKQQSSLPEEIHNSPFSTGDMESPNSKSAESETKNTQTPKETGKVHVNSLQLPTPEEKADKSVAAEETNSPSLEVNYPNLDQSINLTQMISPVSTTDNDVSKALDESNVSAGTTRNTIKPLPSHQLRKEVFQTHNRLTPKMAERNKSNTEPPVAELSSTEDQSAYLVDQFVNNEPEEEQVSSELEIDSEHDKRRKSVSTSIESLEYDVSGIVENYQKQLPLSSRSKGSSVAKLREEVATSGDACAYELDGRDSRDTSNISANSLLQEVSEDSGSNDIEDSILQEQLRPVPLHHKPSPLHLSRRNMSYVLGLHKSPAESSDNKGQIGLRHRAIKSSPPTLRPCRKLEDRQDRSFQTCQDTDPFIDTQSIILEEESLQSDMKQLMNEMNADISQNEESSLPSQANSSVDSCGVLSAPSDHISDDSISSSLPSSSHTTAKQLVSRKENASIDTSIPSKSMLSRLWNSLAFNKPVTDPYLTKYRSLSKVEPWTKTHYKVMDRMYQALKRSPDEFSQSNPSNPPLPRVFSSEIGTKMANWGYSVTFTPEHMILAARFSRLLTVDEAASEDVEVGDCCPGPVGEVINEQTICLRLFSVIVGEDIRRDERSGIPIDRSGRNSAVTQ